MAQRLNAARAAAVAAAEPFGWQRWGAAGVFVALYLLSLVAQLGVGVEALRSAAISLASPAAVFAVLFLWHLVVAQPRRRIQQLQDELSAASEVVSEGVANLNHQMEKARFLRERIDQNPSLLDHAAFDPEINAWIEETVGLVDVVSPADVAGFRADTGQYDKAFDWTWQGVMDHRIEVKNLRLRRLDRHVQRLVDVVQRLRERPTQQP